MQNDCDKAIAQEQKTLEIDPSSPLPYEILNCCYEAMGMNVKALQAEEGSDTLSHGQPEAAAEMKRVYEASGLEGVYQWEIKIADPAQASYNSFDIGIAYARLGDNDKAFFYLRKAYEQRNSRLVFLSVYSAGPGKASLRADPRYTELRRQIG